MAPFSPKPLVRESGRGRDPWQSHGRVRAPLLQGSRPWRHGRERHPRPRGRAAARHRGRRGHAARRGCGGFFKRICLYFRAFTIFFTTIQCMVCIRPEFSGRTNGPWWGFPHETVTKTEIAGTLFHSQAGSIRVFGDAVRQRLLLGTPRSDSSFRQTKTTAVILWGKAGGDEHSVPGSKAGCADETRFSRQTENRRGWKESDGGNQGFLPVPVGQEFSVTGRRFLRVRSFPSQKRFAHPDFRAGAKVWTFPVRRSFWKRFRIGNRRGCEEGADEI